MPRNWEYGAGENECAWVNELLSKHIMESRPMPTLAPEAVLTMLRVLGRWKNAAQEAKERALKAQAACEVAEERMQRMKCRILAAIDHECD